MSKADNCICQFFYWEMAYIHVTDNRGTITLNMYTEATMKQRTHNQDATQQANGAIPCNKMLV